MTLAGTTVRSALWPAVPKAFPTINVAVYVPVASPTVGQVTSAPNSVPTATPPRRRAERRLRRSPSQDIDLTPEVAQLLIGSPVEFLDGFPEHPRPTPRKIDGIWD